MGKNVTVGPQGKQLPLGGSDIKNNCNRTVVNLAGSGLTSETSLRARLGGIV